MEQVSQMANELTQTFSQSPKTSTPTTTSNLSRENHAALFAIINKARMLNGWQTRTAQELDQTIRTWGEMLNSYQIPLAAYPELYRRAFDVRQERMRQGGEVPQMDATLLVSQWTGPNGLQSDLRQREIDQGRTLPSTAQSQCERCLGNEAGFERLFDDQGNAAGLRKNCDHRPIVEGEGIWLHLQRLKENAKPRAA